MLVLITQLVGRNSEGSPKVGRNFIARQKAIDRTELEYIRVARHIGFIRQERSVVQKVIERLRCRRVDLVTELGIEFPCRIGQAIDALHVEPEAIALFGIVVYGIVHTDFHSPLTSLYRCERQDEEEYKSFFIILLLNLNTTKMHIPMHFSKR